MSDHCHYKEFLDELRAVKGGFSCWGYDYNITSPFVHLKYKIKEFFPINAVPDHIMGLLQVAEKELKSFDNSITILCISLAKEVEKMKIQEKNNE
jgi:hypothetical protein